MAEDGLADFNQPSNSYVAKTVQVKNQGKPEQ